MLMKRFRWDKKYLYWGITAYLVIAAAMLFYILVTRLPGIKLALDGLMKILSPFVWGLVIAYLLCPLMKIYQRGLFMPLGNALFSKREDKEARAFKFSRGMAVLLAEITMLIIIAAVVWLIVPRLYQSLRNIVLNSTDYINAAYEWIDKLLSDYPEIEEKISGTYGTLSSGVFGWLSNTILPQLDGIISNVTSGAYYFLKGIYNVIIGMIVSVYVLYNKENFSAGSKKLIYCIFSVEAAEKILSALHFVDQVFIGFLSGKLLDSIIIGLICYIVCLILRMPYTLLVSVIIGVTNIIPFFGPFIGAVPSALIILMEDPLQGLIFVIFVIVLQQFDGNFLGPKILGNSVGINGFWVMFSIIIGAGLFGFMGMLLGVPVFVIIYTGLNALIDRKLRRSGLSTDTEYYRDISHIDPETGEGVKLEPASRRSRKKTRWGDKFKGRPNPFAKRAEKTEKAHGSAEQPEKDEKAARPKTADGEKHDDAPENRP